jgi:Uncharacterized conserved protein (DUF2285)
MCQLKSSPAKIARRAGRRIGSRISGAPYDQEHAITYMRMLDADAEGADWREVARIVLHIDPDRNVQRARRAFDSHRARAKWMSREGYKYLLRSG